MISIKKGEILRFWCPGCDDLHQVDSKWTTSGTPESPTIQPSVLMTRQYHPDMKVQHGLVDDVCHSFVTDGRIQFLGDCTHALANLTVDLPHLPDWVVGESQS